MSTNHELDTFLAGKSDYTMALFHHLVAKFNEIGQVDLHPAKTMIGISNGKKRIAWVTQLGKTLFTWCFHLSGLIMITCVFKK